MCLCVSLLRVTVRSLYQEGNMMYCDKLATWLLPALGLVVSVCVSSARFVKADGSLYGEGDVMYCDTLAGTLETVATDAGVWDMYNGSLARSIVQDLGDIGL